MSRNVVYVRPEQTVWEAVNAMVQHNIGAILVGDGSSYSGILTERDIMKRVTLDSLDPTVTEVRRVMSSPLITVQADQGLGEASLLMLEKRIRRLVVMDNETVAGILTERDISRSSLDVLLAMSRAS